MQLQSHESIAFAAIGIAVVETVKIYTSTAPTLRELRYASPDPSYNFETRQLLLDADFMGLLIVGLLGGGGAFLTGRWYPLILGIAALVTISAYYRSVLKSSNHGLVA
jgi:hypothetical protein